MEAAAADFDYGYDLTLLFAPTVFLRTAFLDVVEMILRSPNQKTGFVAGDQRIEAVEARN